jgi:hypothetical protein
MQCCSDERFHWLVPHHLPKDLALVIIPCCLLQSDMAHDTGDSCIQLESILLVQRHTDCCTAVYVTLKVFGIGGPCINVWMK